MYQPTVTHRIAKALVSLMFYGSIVCVVSLPFLSNYITEYFGCGQRDCRFMTAVLIASGLCTVYILYNLRRMYRSLLGGNPFVETNIGCLRKMAVSCALIADRGPSADVRGRHPFLPDAERHLQAGDVLQRRT
jgi:hypothetical protein